MFFVIVDVGRSLGSRLASKQREISSRQLYITTHCDSRKIICNCLWKDRKKKMKKKIKIIKSVKARRDELSVIFYTREQSAQN